MVSCELDHIVVAALSLAEGVRFVADKLGVEMPPGGRHQSMGTHNHLMQIGPGSFFEVIAINPDMPPPSRSRWYALDDAEMRIRLADGPELITWVIRCNEIEEVASRSLVDLGAITPVTRGMLSWRLTIPEDGHLPGGGTVPHVIEWDGGARPWESMADLGCSMVRLTLRHPDIGWLKRALEAVGADSMPMIDLAEGGVPDIIATIRRPSGELVEI